MKNLLLLALLFPALAYAQESPAPMFHLNMQTEPFGLPADVFIRWQDFDPMQGPIVGYLFPQTTPSNENSVSLDSAYFYSTGRLTPICNVLLKGADIQFAPHEGAWTIERFDYCDREVPILRPWE